MNRKIICMEHIGATAKIFGNCDSNAHRIEKQFGVTLRNRETEAGDSIIIEGEDVEMMDRLLSLAITGGEWEWI